MNKLLHSQLQKYPGGTGKIPGKLKELLQAISDSYDHFEKEHKLTENSIEQSSKEMIELNCQLKKEKKDLKKAHKQLKALFEDINEVLYSVDMVSYNLIEISAVCEKIYGYTAEEFLADNDLWQKLIHAEDKQIVEEQVKSLSQGKQVLNQYRIVHKNKSIRWIENKIIPTIDETGRLVRIDGVTSDVSERKHTEEELEKSFSLLEATIESTADGILVADFNGKIVLFNKKFVELMRLPKEILDSRDDEKAIAFVLDQLISPLEFLSKVKALYGQKSAVSFDILKFKDGRVFERYSQPQLIKGNFVGRVWSFRDVSERKLVEEELERSFSLLEATLESTADGILVVDPNARVVRLNNKFIELWRIPLEMLETGDDQMRIEFLSNQLVNPGEFISKIKELNTRQNEVSLDILRFKDGRVFERYSQPQLIKEKYVGRVWSFRDITERKNNEERLRENERRLRQIIDLVPHFIFAKDAKGKFILANEAMAIAYGSTTAGLIGKSDADFNPNKEEVEHFITEDLAVRNSGNANYHIEETITDTSGRTRILSTAKIPYSFPGVDSPGVLGVSVDISERKIAETALIKREGQLTIAARIAKLGYWEFDVIKGLFTFDDQFYAIFKTTAEKAGGYTMAADRYARLFVYPDDRDVVGMEVGNAINSPDRDFNRQIEHRIIYANGETGWISVHFYIVKDGDGRTVKTFGVNQDITERKKGEETLRISEMNLEIKNTQLRQKNTELEQFAFIASHDLQEPLRTTSGFIKLLQKQSAGKLDPKADQYFTYILEASERMKELIKNLLDYSRIGNKKEWEQVDCDKIIHDVIADLGTAISETEAEIKYDLLPVINGYSTELKQLFQNLLTNAMKFRKKGIPPKIDISVQIKESYWQFTFKDNGIGIEAKDSEKIFDIFHRLHTRIEYEGSGIGLSHCKKIVELHKGKIWVESTPGEGSTFHFTINQNDNR